MVGISSGTIDASAAAADEQMNRLVLQLATVAEKHGIKFPRVRHYIMLAACPQRDERSHRWSVRRNSHQAIVCLCSGVCHSYQGFTVLECLHSDPFTGLITV